MRKPMKDLPVRKTYFSEKVKGVEIFSEEWGDMVCACHRFAKGVDFTPHLVGQPDDLCPIPHYGYCFKGVFHVRYKDGHEEVMRGGDVFYLPPAHTMWVDEDTEVIEFSPLKVMSEGEKLAQTTLGSKK